MNLIVIKPEPVMNAEKIIQEYQFKSPIELDLELIANAEKLIVEETELHSMLGKITFDTECGIIKINNKIKDTGQKRFTLAHELGHYFNEKDTKTNPLYRHIDKYLSFNTGKKYEDNANIFAAELLMPRPWFNNFIIKRDINFELIKEIANYFNVSLSAAAFRYVNIGKYPAAVIYNKDGVVQWSAFHDYFPFKFIPKGYKVKKESSAYDFFAGKTMQTCSDLVQATVWFPDNSKVKTSTYLYEQNAAMPNYNAVLTLLWESEFV